MDFFRFLRKAAVRDQGGSIKIRIILDRFSVEIFVNDGEQVLSSCLYTPQEADADVYMNVEKYGIAVE